MIYNLYAMYSYIFTILFTLSPLCTFNSLLKSLVIKLVYTTFVFFLTVNLLWIFFWCLLSSILYFFPLWQADKKAWVLPPLGMYWIEIPLTPTSAPNHNQVPGQSPFLAPSRHVILAWGACPALPGDISYVSNKPLPTILVCVCVCVCVRVLSSVSKSKPNFGWSPSSLQVEHNNSLSQTTSLQQCNVLLPLLCGVAVSIPASL